jgi:hypothetical protein
VAARTIIAQLWSGAVVVRRVGLSAAEQATRVDAMSDLAISASLAKLGIDPALGTAAERRARLRAWPSPADLDALADRYIADNGGVRPTVRVLEVMSLPTGRGTPGSVPR